MKTTISAKGQVTIPKPLRERFGLTAGSQIDFNEEGGRIVAVKVGSEDRAGKWLGKGKLPIGRNAEEYIEILRQR